MNPQDIEYNIISTIEFQKDANRFPSDYPEVLSTTRVDPDLWERFINALNNAATEAASSNEIYQKENRKKRSCLKRFFLCVILPIGLILFLSEFLVVLYPGIMYLILGLTENCTNTKTCNKTSSLTTGGILTGIGGIILLIISILILICCVGTFCSVKDAPKLMEGLSRLYVPNLDHMAHEVNLFSWECLQQDSPFYIRYRSGDAPQLLLGQFQNPPPFVQQLHMQQQQQQVKQPME